jgi:molecular chaperone GrpE
MGEEREYSESVTEAEERIEIEFRDDDDEAEQDPVAEEANEPEIPEQLETPEQPEQPKQPETSDSLEQEIQRLSDELEQLREMYLRKLAEFDNYRKRTDREREELQRTAAEGTIRELLPIVDNFERALQHAGNGDPEAFRQGVEMIARQLLDMLEREGLEAIDPDGESFDPELHEAVHRVEDSEHQPGTVVQVLNKGYALSGRLIRPAMVGVAVQPNEPESPATSEPEADDEGGGGS